MGCLQKLESQIENIKDSIEKLGIEWFNLAKAQEVGISGLEGALIACYRD